MKKFLFNLIGLLILLALLAIIAGIGWLKFFGADFLESKLNEGNPFPVAIEQAGVTVRGGGGGVNFRGITVQNPDAFPSPNFLNLDNITGTINPLSLFREELVLPEVSLEIPQVTIVRAQDNSVNLVLFMGGLAQQLRSKPDGGDSKPFLIRNLTIRVHQLELRDYRRGGGPPSVNTVDVGFNLEMQDVRAVSQILQGLTGELSRLGTRAVGTWAVQALEAGFTERAREGLRNLLNR